MKSQFFAVALVTAVGIVRAQSTNMVLDVSSSIQKPTVEANVHYRSAKIEYGQVENDESVFGYEVQLEWCGFLAGFETCHDLTDKNERAGRMNEMESFGGYRYEWGDLSAKVAYVYKAIYGHEEPDTQEVEVEITYKTPWVKPFLELQCDTKRKAGALRGGIGVVHDWEFTDGVSLVTLGGIGLGNPYHNEWCFECARWAFREMHLGVALELELCPHFKLVPRLDLYDYFTANQRHAYDKFNGFIAVAGCHLVVEF